MFDSLTDFINYLEKKGELLRTSEPISPVLEMTEIGCRLIEKQGPALLIEHGAWNMEHSKKPMLNAPVSTLLNLFGTQKRVAYGLGLENVSEIRELGKQLAFLKQPEPPVGWREALELLPLLKTVMAMKPKTVSNAPCQ
jgi:4-hydroxy-3-polyprenylbenzoate decarboxylase